MPPSIWTTLNVTTLTISSLALITSLTSLWFAWRNHVRAEAQDRRRKPTLSLYLIDGQICTSPSGNFYCFKVQIRNPSDTDTAISLIEFRAVFTMADKTSLIAKIGQISSTSFPATLGEALLTPVKVGAHNIVTGWCVFELTAALVGDKALESYALEFHDTHAVVSALAPRLLKRKDEF